MEFPRKEVEDLFEEVRDLPRGKRTQALAKLCGDNRALLIEVESLLAFYDQPTSLLDKAPKVTEEIANMQSKFGMPESIGGCQILEVLGSGGMGIVYLAQQTTPVKRQVAIKVIKGGMDTENVIRRFEAERQALAVMDHAGIAKIFDAGITEEGSPYFMMEFVRGIPITNYCNDNHLSLDERIAIFCQICDAVQHAHSKGVIHRDIKPDNILVSGYEKPIAKIIDFGVAKAAVDPTGPSLLVTQHGAIIGTPAYMSPEQAGSTDEDIDTRADIYSLGVVLYELLTGSLPFEPKQLQNAGLAEIQRMIQEDDPPKPSARFYSTTKKLKSTISEQRGMESRILEKRIRGDLDWVIMKCLEKPRERRYDSPSEIARELRRYQANEPVEAGPPSIRYRSGKFMRRHVGAIVATSIVAVVLIAGIVGTSVGLVKSNRALVAAEIARSGELEQIGRLEQVNNFLNKDLLAAAAPSSKEGRGIDVTVLEVLDVASNKLETKFEEDPVVEAALRETIGSTYHKLGKFEKASKHLLIAEKLNRKLDGDDGESTLRISMLLSQIDEEMGNYDKSKQRLLDVIASADSSWGRTWFEAHHRLGTVYMVLNQFEDSAKHLSEARVSGVALWGEDEPIVISSQCKLLMVLHRIGNMEEAEQVVSQLTEWLENDDSSSGEAVLKLGVLNALSDFYYFNGKENRAIELMEEQLAIKKDLMGEEHPKTIEGMARLATVYHQSGRLEDARSMFEKAVPALQNIYGETHVHTLAMVNNLAELYVDLGELELAKPLYEYAIENGSKVLPEDHQYLQAFKKGYKDCLDRLSVVSEEQQ